MEFRLSQRVKGIATIFLYSNTETELKERMDRLDDAVQAVRAAYDEGISPGGGVALKDIAKKGLTSNATNNTQVAFFKALKRPFKQILNNAGLRNYIPRKVGYGVDVRTQEVVNMKEFGIIDATKSIRVALESAVSVACSLLVVGATITNKR